MSEANEATNRLLKLSDGATVSIASIKMSNENPGQTVSRALGLLELITKEVRQGAKIIIQEPNGRQREIILDNF